MSAFLNCAKQELPMYCWIQFTNICLGVLHLCSYWDWPMIFKNNSCLFRFGMNIKVPHTMGSGLCPFFLFSKKYICKIKFFLPWIFCWIYQWNYLKLEFSLGRLKTTNSVYLMVIGLFVYSISFRVQVGKFYYSRNLSIISKVPNLLE